MRGKEIGKGIAIKACIMTRVVDSLPTCRFRNTCSREQKRMYHSHCLRAASDTALHAARRTPHVCVSLLRRKALPGSGTHVLAAGALPLCH
jgi:hypothetical protein